jgi:ATP-dependent DNA helicase DinG
VRAQPARVAIDLETTGLHAEQDAIVEIGAVKFAGDEVLDTFETFVAPGIPLPYRIQRLTGIAPAQLRAAPPLVTMLPRLRAFLEDLPLVGHNIPFDVAFLRRVGLAHRNPQIDTYELASALMPVLKNYTLASVAEALAIPGETHHRALADAQLARQVLLALLGRLDALDTGILEALAALPAPREWTLSYFLRQQVRSRQPPPLASVGGFGGLLTSSLGEQLRSKLEVDPEALSLAVASGQEDPTSTPSSVAYPGQQTWPPLAEEALACLDEGGVLLAEMPGDDAHVRALVAAAVRWSARTGERVWLVAADGADMRRLAGELIPDACVRAGIPSEHLAIAELAERDAYLCLHRWFGAARLSPDGPLARGVVHGLAKMLVWVRETHTGLRAEIALPGQEAQAWDLVRAGAEFDDGWSTCAYRREGYCFAARAWERAQSAKVIVTTHAALAASLAGGGSPLPDASRVMVLHAGLLEDELRRAASETLERDGLLALLRQLAIVESGGRRVGLLHSAGLRLGSERGTNRERVWFQTVASATQAAEAFFSALRGLLTETSGQSGERAQNEAGDQRWLRLDAKTWSLSGWDAVQDAWTLLERRLLDIAELAHSTALDVHRAEDSKKPLASHGLAVELLGVAHRLERMARAGALALAAEEHENELRWLRVPYPSNDEPAGRTGGASPSSDPRAKRWAVSSSPANVDEAPRAPEGAPPVVTAQASLETPPAPVVNRAMIHVGALLAPLCAQDRALVLAGSALQVGGDFDHIRGILGLPDGTRRLVHGSDRSEQTLLGLPEDVPEPNATHFQRALEQMLVALGGALGGRMVALFPSHAALRATCTGIRRNLERQDILVLAQGQDGSARQLWHTFNTQPRTILLGAGGFWSGREQGDQPPACVLVARLPFPALSDPVHAARSEQWEDPQAQYVVPQAALKLRQALNGLAWSHSRRNAVVLFDRRIQTRGYGQTILGTLPHCTQRCEPVERLVETIAGWVE